MSSLKELETAFEADLLLAGARLEALALIGNVMKDVADLGFRVELAPSVGPVASRVDVTFWIDVLDADDREMVTDPNMTSPDEWTVVDMEQDLVVGVDAETVTPDLIPLMGARKVHVSDPVPDPVPVASPVEPAAVEVPVAVPPAAKPDYQSRYAGLKPGSDPLSDEDRATILRMSKDGATSGEIAAALGRDPRGFYHVINKTVHQADAEQVLESKPAPVEAAPVAVQPVAPVVNIAPAPPFQGDNPDKMTASEARIAARLDALGNKGRWSDPADDRSWSSNWPRA